MKIQKFGDRIDVMSFMSTNKSSIFKNFLGTECHRTLPYSAVPLTRDVTNNHPQTATATYHNHHRAHLASIVNLSPSFYHAIAKAFDRQEFLFPSSFLSTAAFLALFFLTNRRIRRVFRYSRHAALLGLREAMMEMAVSGLSCIFLSVLLILPLVAICAPTFVKCMYLANQFRPSPTISTCLYRGAEACGGRG